MSAMLMATWSKTRLPYVQSQPGVSSRDRDIGDEIKAVDLVVEAESVQDIVHKVANNELMHKCM
jgi:hypothetical protein